MQEYPLPLKPGRINYLADSKGNYNLLVMGVIICMNIRYGVRRD